MNGGPRSLFLARSTMIALALVALGVQSRAKPDAMQKMRVISYYVHAPLAFQAVPARKGAGGLFVARGVGYGLSLKPTAATLALFKAKGDARLSKFKTPRIGVPKPQSFSVSRLGMRLLGANAHARGVLEGILPGRTNYIIGNDPKKWRVDVRSYAKVHYRDVYHGVDLVYYGSNGSLEYDFVVKPGANPRAIRLAFSGADSLKVGKHGDLVARMGSGEVRWRNPEIYQIVGNRKVRVAGNFANLSSGRVGFRVARYNSRLPLVIDPQLVYSTYLGGSIGDAATSIAVDNAGNAYVAGSTGSFDFPVKNAFQGQNKFVTGIDETGFVTKLDSSGQLAYSTYLGGSGGDQANSIAVDDAGNAYVAGLTFSHDFPVKNAFQWQNKTSNNSVTGYNDTGFVTKLDFSGQLAYSTYLGGSSNDSAHSIAVDGAGNAYVAGETGSNDFPVKNAFQGQFKYYQGFVTKLDSSGQLAYSTYLGGSSLNFAYSIAVDGAGNAYVAGLTFSHNFPVKNAFQGQNKASWGTGFVTKLDSSGQLAYSTYLGGSVRDYANSIAVDGAGNTYVAGWTQSSDFPTMNAFQGQNKTNGNYTGFVTKLDSSGQLVYSTYLGGSSADEVRSIAVDGAGNAYVAGLTFSSDFPVRNAFQGPMKTQYCIGFVAKMDSSDQLVYSSYLGGSYTDAVYSIAVDGAGNAYVTGKTFSYDFPVINAFQGQLRGYPNAFVAKIGPLAILRISLPYGNGSQYQITRSGNDVAVTISVSNAGTDTAPSVSVVSATLGVAHASALPVNLGDIVAGGSSVCTLHFPNPGVSGTNTVLRISVKDSTGQSQTLGLRVRLP